LHYDLATPFYRLLWGPHIHHGLWQQNEPSALAQIHLTERLAAEADIRFGDHVLDVGCGMGGSSIHLARVQGCHVRGLTLSPVQRLWASISSVWQRVSKKVHFECADAERVSIPEQSFDVVWSIECTEHFFDKPAFFERAAHWLKPGGRMAICAWLAGDEPHSAATAEQVQTVCKGFLCPSLGTSAEYQHWMQGAGLELQASHDWSQQVARTWEICERRVHAAGIPWLARLTNNKDMAQFLQHFATIRRAFETGAMKYGCFVARRA
jgi:tocopherol O-methyltransferase